jgi:hypothetical protein
LCRCLVNAISSLRELLSPPLYRNPQASCIALYEARFSGRDVESEAMTV